MEIKNITNKTKLILLVSMLAISLVAFNTLQLVDAIHPPGRDIVTETIIPGSNTISFRDISNTNPTISSGRIDTLFPRADGRIQVPLHGNRAVRIGNRRSR